MNREKENKTESFRPIRFRVWDKKEKRMYPYSDTPKTEPLTKEEYESRLLRGKYDILLILDGGLIECWNDPTLEVTGSGVTNKDAIRLTTNIVDDLVLMQYTGLKDKNGKEIYEGDIVKGKYPYGTAGIITWIDERASFMISMLDGLNGGSAYDKKGYKLNSFKCEIIGNIYENPELINK